MKFFARLFGRKITSVHKSDGMGTGAVSFDDERIVRHLADGRTETIRWDEIQRVSIVTTDDGPFVDDVFWVITGENGGCLVPSETQGTKELLSRLQLLPDFKNEAVITAMGSTARAEFICWQRSERA